MLADPTLKPFSYVIKSLDDYAWYSPEHKHTVSDQGLLIIRPVFPEDRRPALNWQSLVSSAAGDETPDDDMTEALRKYLDDDAGGPPAALRRFMGTLAEEMGNPVLYYSCSMWAGSVESEFCLAYTPAERLFTTDADSPNTEQHADALRAGLALIDVHLPSRFFALHTRDFPWDAHRLVGNRSTSNAE